VDPRSDVFSLGVVLYEMATGRRPFRGGTASALLAAVLKDTPPLATELRPELPRDLGRLLRRALQKDPEERIQTAKELRNELRELKAEAGSGEAWERPVEGPPSRRRWVVLGGLAAVALALGVAIWSVMPEAPAPGPLTVTPITSDAAREAAVSLSPDGKLLIYSKKDDEGWGLFVRQIGGGEPLRIAQADVPLVGGFSPDGSRIAFIPHRPRAASGVFIIPALGGPQQRIGTTHSFSTTGLSWSPDGRLLALTDGDPSEKSPLDHIALLDVDTGGKRRLTTPPPEYLGGDIRPRLSPDGRTLAFLRGQEGYLYDIYLVPV
jgi:hypothetical protein